MISECITGTNPFLRIISFLNLPSIVDMQEKLSAMVIGHMEPWEIFSHQRDLSNARKCEERHLPNSGDSDVSSKKTKDRRLHSPKSHTHVGGLCSHHISGARSVLFAVCCCGSPGRGTYITEVPTDELGWLCVPSERSAVPIGSSPAPEFNSFP